MDFDMVSLRLRQIDFVTVSSLVGSRYLKEFLLERCELRYIIQLTVKEEKAKP